MFVSALSVRDFKGVESVDLRPDEVGLILIAGDNDAGKSSVLDAIATAIGGPKLAPERPIRDGATEARLEVVLDGVGEEAITVTRILRADGADKLVVTNAKGHKIASPQRALDALFAAFSFDPLEFERSKPAQQREMLLRAVGLGDTLAKLNAERKTVFSERTFVARELKQAEGHLASLPAPPAVIPDAIDTAELRARVSAATRAASAKEIASVAARNAAEKVRRYAADIADMERRIAALRDDAQKAAHEAEQKKSEAAAIVVEDSYLLEEELQAAEDINRDRDVALRASEARKAAEAKIAAKRAEVASLTQRIEQIDQSKRDAVSSVTLPIPGLSVAPDATNDAGEVSSEGGVTLHGVPFAQASASARLKASFVVAASLQSKLRVALCRHGERLDGKSLDALRTAAHELGFQFFVERVGTADAGAIVIEAGKVKA